jgi:hypothetical protein
MHLADSRCITTRFEDGDHCKVEAARWPLGNKVYGPDVL